MNLHAGYAAAQFLAQLRFSESVPEARLSTAQKRQDKVMVEEESMCADALAYSTASFPDRVPSFAKKKSDPKVERADSSLGG